MTDHQTELAKIEQAIAAQENLRGILPDEQIEATLAALQKKRATIVQQAEQGQVVAHSQVGGDVLAAGASITYILNQYLTGEEQLSTSTELGRQVADYLTWLSDRCGTIELRGIKREGQQVVQLNLETVYVPLTAEIYEPSVKDRLDPAMRETGITRSISLDEVLSLGQRIILTGGPGCGKTTVLLHIAWALARAITGDDPKLAHSKLGLKDELPLPIFVPLSAYATYIRRLPPGTAARNRTLAAFISHYLIEKQSSFDLPGDFFQRLLQDGQAVILLLDGLDEVPDEAERVRVRQAIEELVTGRETMQVVVTCRMAAYKERTALGKGFQEVRVTPLDDEHIEALIRQAYGHIYRSDPAVRRSKADELLQGIRDMEAARRRRLGEKVERLVSSPLLVRMLLVVHFSERRLPEQRAELYMKATDAMLLPEYALDEEIADRIGRLVGGSREVHRDLVQFLAFAMHNQGEEKGREIGEDDLRRVLGSDPAYAGLIDDFVALTRLRGTLLEERLGMYRFIHLAFQEYLAARYLAEVVRSVEEMAAFLKEGRLLDSWWREPALLVGGYLSVTSPRTAQAFLQRLAKSEGTPEIQMAGAEVAATALLEWPTSGDELRSELAGQLAELFQDKEIVNRSPVSRRAAAGRVLGLLGDPREGITTLPPLLTSPIQGQFLYGEKKEERETAPFQAGVYPVTNAQFGHFIEAGGYKNQKWWSEEGWRWRQKEAWSQPLYWDDSRWNNPNHPVVGVSWYEAEAFCKWLTDEYGQQYRLPTEEEWERLARGRHGRKYPWGNQWEEGLANTRESKIGQTSAAGIFPGGVSPTGAYDCAGNVFEWCQDWYDEDKDVRVLRGGSWDLSADWARCSSRYDFLSSRRYYYIGFRVLVSHILFGLRPQEFSKPLGSEHCRQCHGSNIE